MTNLLQPKPAYTRRAVAVAGLLASTLLLAAAVNASAQQSPGQPTAPAQRSGADDPYRWLEDVEGARSMAWVRAHNAATMKTLGADSLYRSLNRRILGVLNARDRIAYPTILGDRLYNFWQDAQHPRGIWRSTSWPAYLAGKPEWSTVLDIDSLAQAEKVPWAWRGADCLPPEYRRCLVELSRGGADATELRELDVPTRSFLRDGFHLPEAKQSVAWLSPDEVLVSTDFGPGSLTTSGYPRIAKLWRRGTPLAEARTLVEGKTTDVSVDAASELTPHGLVGIVYRSPSFFESELHVVRGDSAPQATRLDLPLDAMPRLAGDQLLVRLRSPWHVGDASFTAGSLVALPLDTFLAGRRDFRLVLQPTERQAIEQTESTRGYLLVALLDNVQPKLLRYHVGDGSWRADTVPVPAAGDIAIRATSPTTDRFFFSYAGFLKPTTLYATGEDGSVQEVQQLPARFQADGLMAEQHEATSPDGTKVPYFIVHRRGMPHDAKNPTLLYGYGGFEVPETPDYNPVLGASWLERGGVYVLANIRGGGEFGPAWHKAALKENRQRAYDDFIAVAQDLVRHGVTSPAHLGIMGGSNGGLLMGVMLTERPDLWKAVVILNPLLDMFRYSHLLAGASWMAEYGDPDVPAEWAYISRYSPYQNLKAGVKYPRVFIATTTRDDRVHPGHARKFAAKLDALGQHPYFFENTEGGHGSGVTSEQRAREQALVYTYLWDRLR